MPSVPEISVDVLAERLRSQDAFILLDVREPWEIAIASLPGSIHIPLNEIPRRLKELDAASAIIVMCKVGGRSQRVAD